MFLFMHFHALFSRSANDLPPGKTATFLERNWLRIKGLGGIHERKSKGLLKANTLLNAWHLFCHY